VFLHFYRAINNPGGLENIEPADPYISISEDWQPSNILIDAAADHSDNSVGIDLSQVQHNRRHALIMYNGNEWTDEAINQNIIDVFKLHYFWTIVRNGTATNQPASLSDNWKIDTEGYLVSK